MNFLKALFKFVPVVALAVMMIKGFDALIAAAIAWLVALVVCAITEGYKFPEMLDASMSSVSRILVALFILMYAYAMASCFMSYGVGAAVVNIALAAGVTASTVAVVGFLCTCVLSVATGTSWGTFAACAPIFMWLGDIVGANQILVVCAIAGGACFGDNIGLISDTTIVSSGIHGVQVVDRIRHQGVWSISCAAISAILFFITGKAMNLPTERVNGAQVVGNISQEVWDFLAEERPAAVSLLEQVRDGVPYYMVIPLILVIVLAILGVHTFGCIGTGIITSYVLGCFAGTAPDIMGFLEEITTGFADAGSWVIVMMMWVAAFGGVMGKMRAFDPLANLIIFASKKVRHMLGWNSVLAIIGNAILADEMAQIVTIGPVIKEITDENVVCENEEDRYKLNMRNATFNDAMGVFGSQLIPWHVYLAFYVGIIAGVYPLLKVTAMDFLRYNYMAYVAVISLILLTFTGLDKFIPLFKLPSEPAVRLKTKEERDADKARAAEHKAE